MKKPPKRLVIKPGRYRTRDGSVAVVSKAKNNHEDWPWRGVVCGSRIESWRGGGESSCIPNNEHPDDLIRRLPDEPPKPAKRERMEWAVVIPCGTDAKKALAQRIAKLVRNDWSQATVRRLPMLPATRKET